MKYLIHQTSGTRRRAFLTSLISLTFLIALATLATSPARTESSRAGGRAANAFFQETDLGVTKTANFDQIGAGSNLTYTITVINGGPDDAINATLTDILPLDLTFVSLSAPAGWSCSTPAVGANGTVTCSHPSLPVTTGVVFTMVAKVNPAAVASSFISNKATVTTQTTDVNDENDNSTANTQVVGASADVGVTKIASAENVFANTDVTYTITVINGGPDDAANVSLTDPLGGAGSTMTFVSLSSPAGWSCTTPAVGASGTVTCTNASLALTNGQTFTLVGHVPPGTPAGTVYPNTATVSTTTSDPNTENDNSVASTTVVSCFTSSIVTTNADGGAGSLRQAIVDACSGGVIGFDMSPGHVTNPITLTSGELIINKDLTIQGPGVPLTVMRSTGGATPNFRVFTVANLPITVDISGITISNGRTANGAAAANGGDGGGIFNGSGASLNLKNVTVSGNFTGNGGVGANGGNGGGIYNAGNLTLTNSTVSGNTTGNGSAGNGGDGGGIYNAGVVTLTNATISGNLTGNGVTAGNGGHGGGIFNNTGATVTIANATISNNQTGTGGGAGLGGNGGGVRNAGTANVSNTIIAGNLVASGGQGPDFSGPFSSQDYNLIGNTSGATITGATSHNIINQSAVLAALANNGGPTQTMQPLPDSPAINAGDPANLPADTFDLDNDNDTAEALPTDQRGFSRVVGPKFDIGSVETNYVVSATGGTPQSTVITTPFAIPLQVTVTESGTNQSGIFVLFAAPITGPSGKFPGNTAVANATTNASGVATAPVFTANGTAGGPYNVIAGIGPGLATATFALTNTKAATLTGVTSSINPSNPGQGVTFTATVTSAAGTPTGTVQFKDNGTNIGGPATLNGSGVATVSTSTLTAGAHTITADYGGDSNFLASTGALSGGQTVNNVPLISFSQSTYNVNEGAGFISITVNRTGDTSPAVTVDFATSDDSTSSGPCVNGTGIASSRCDFISTFGTLRFAANETQKTFVVLITLDTYNEVSEMFTLALSNPTGGALFATPSNATVTIDDGVTALPPNAIDDTNVFVRQQYHDFLNREADNAGLVFWTNEINSCGGNAQCIEVKRINVSAAFFFSIEFQQSGGLVRNAYVAALDRPATNNMPAFVEFERDTQAIQRGLIVGQGAWQAQLDANRIAFLNDFVMRPEFIGLYPTTDAPTQYVDKLYLHAAVMPNSTERNNAIAEFGSATTAADPGARGRVLLRVAQNATFTQREFTRGFVQIEYFCYLRRNPDQAGYNFWLNRLNAAGGNYIQAEMIKAFLRSQEYRQRFGP